MTAMNEDLKEWITSVYDLDIVLASAAKDQEEAEVNQEVFAQMDPEEFKDFISTVHQISAQFHHDEKAGAYGPLIGLIVGRGLTQTIDAIYRLAEGGE